MYLHVFLYENNHFCLKQYRPKAGRQSAFPKMYSTVFLDTVCSSYLQYVPNINVPEVAQYTAFLDILLVKTNTTAYRDRLPLGRYTVSS